MYKPYSVVYADPPWKFSSRGAVKGKYGELPYQQMATKEICDMKLVSQITARDCALFLWFPGSHNVDAIQVSLAWGFEPIRIDKVWEKIYPSGAVRGNPGPWGYVTAEFQMLAVKGSMWSKQVQRNQKTVYRAEVPGGRHSAKPKLFADLIVDRFPNENRIELFARDKKDGWSVWGNEV